MAAMSVLEAQYRPNLTVEDGIALLTDAITSGILNDMGSGSNVDLCILRPGVPVDYRRSAVPGHSRLADHARRAAVRLPVSGPEPGPISLKPYRRRVVRLERGEEGAGSGAVLSLRVGQTDDPDDEVELL